MGIEPTWSAWKAEVLPLNYIRNYVLGNSFTSNIDNYTKKSIYVNIFWYFLYLSLFFLIVWYNYLWEVFMEFERETLLIGDKINILKDKTIFFL